MLATLHSLVTVLLIAGAAVYTGALVALVLGKRPFGLVLMALGWLLTLGLFVANWLCAGGPPFGSMYHVMVFMAVCFPPLYLFLSVRNKLWQLDRYFVLLPAIALAGALFMPRDLTWRRMPALQSPWFVPHVTAYMLSYALVSIAFAITVAGFFPRRRTNAATAAWHDEACYQTTRLAFPLMTFGLLSGALWAEEAWGIYWSWDPKETWALITWLLYVIYLHCQQTPALRRYARSAQVCAFVALLVTFLLVNLLPRLGSILHSYA